jgi:hypothetical protein
MDVKAAVTTIGTVEEDLDTSLGGNRVRETQVVPGWEVDGDD